MVEHVLLQHASIRESLPALGADVRSLSGVHTHVYSHFVGHCEAFAAHRALERPLSRVGEPVGAHGTHLGEGLPAIWANVRLLARVNPGVASQSSGCGETLRAVRALVRTLACVSAHVLLQVVAVSEATTTDGTALGSVVVVAQLVIGQAFLRQETLAALLTLVRLFMVDPLVVLELADSGKRLIAVPAPEAMIGAVGKLVLSHLMVPQQVGHLEGLSTMRTLVFGQQLHTLVSDAFM